MKEGAFMHSLDIKTDFMLGPGDSTRHKRVRMFLYSQSGESFRRTMT